MSDFKCLYVLPKQNLNARKLNFVLIKTGFILYIHFPRILILNLDYFGHAFISVRKVIFSSCMVEMI
jgi:hypothetical protein